MMTQCVDGIRVLWPKYLILSSTAYIHEGPSPKIFHWYYQCFPRMYKTHDKLNMPLSEEWLVGENQLHESLSSHFNPTAKLHKLLPLRKQFLMRILPPTHRSPLQDPKFMSLFPWDSMWHISHALHGDRLLMVQPSQSGYHSLSSGRAERQPIYLIYGSTILCWTSPPFLVSWSYTRPIGLRARGISPSQGRYPHTEHTE
jgi:hypothetical protein